MRIGYTSVLGQVDNNPQGQYMGMTQAQLTMIAGGAAALFILLALMKRKRRRKTPIAVAPIAAIK